MSNTKVTLNEKQWKSFCKTLEGLGKQCNDVDIKDGVIRQRSNDRFSIIEVDTKAMLGNSTFAIANIKEKLKVLKGLTGDVAIEAEQDKVVFSDGASSCSIPAPDMGFLNNNYLPKSDLDSAQSDIPQGTPPLINYRIDKKDIKRIRSAASALKSNSYRVHFDNDSASIRLEEGGWGSKDSKSSVEVIKGIPVSQPTKGSMAVTISPFTSFDYDGDIRWEVYGKDNVAIGKYFGAVGDVNTASYTKSPLIDDPPEPPPPTEEPPKDEGEEIEIES